LIPEGSEFGYSVAKIGDLDENGINDMVVRAPGDRINETFDPKGAIYVLLLDIEGRSDRRTMSDSTQHEITPFNQPRSF
jgi:hypothetical protein